MDDQNLWCSAIRFPNLVKGQHLAMASVLRVESSLPSSSNIINQFIFHIKNQSRSSVLWLQSSGYFQHHKAQLLHFLVCPKSIPRL